VKIPHPLGEPTADAERDAAVRLEIVQRALIALSAPVGKPTIF
jgi:hypothetical protein